MDNSDVERLIGRTLEGRFRVKRLLDQGGTSYILLAFHEQLEVHVVLKVLNKRSENNDNLFAHSVQEARLLARLNHPNIVRLHDFFQGGEVDALVLEHIEGQNLARLSRGQPMAWPRACRLLLQCCAAVEALHEAGFLHRDLNPQNFMVQRGVGEEDERVKLIDLGTAKHIAGQEPLADALELTTTIPPCTPAYIAPEHARGELRGSVAADTYGLAVTLYACVFGRPPWTTGTIELLLRQIGTEPAQLPENVVLPPALRQLLARGLDKDPARRFGSPAELAAAIRAVLKPRAAEVTGAPTARRPELAAGRGRGARRLVAAAVAGVAVLGGLAVTMHATAEPLQVRLEETEASPAPEPLALVLPSASRPPAQPPAELAGVQPPAELAAPAAKMSRPLELSAQLRRLAPRLRRCPAAPTGRVLVELDHSGLRRLDLEELDRADPWHRCASAVLAAVRGEARVDLQL